MKKDARLLALTEMMELIKDNVFEVLFMLYMYCRCIPVE